MDKAAVLYHEILMQSNKDKALELIREYARQESEDEYNKGYEAGRKDVGELTEKADLNGYSRGVADKEEYARQESRNSQEPIEDALYSTGKFTTDECTELAKGIIQYIIDFNQQEESK
jgi:hypothetical protein